MGRTIYEDVVNTLAFIVMAFLWRGAWNLNAKFMIEDELIGGWVNHVIGTALLIALQVLEMVGGCGCPVDGDDIVTSSGGFFHTEYLRHLLKPDKPSNEVNTVVELSVIA